jgi:hypothetical protein
MSSKKKTNKQKSKPAASTPQKEAVISVDSAPNETPNASNTTTATDKQPRTNQDDTIPLLQATIAKKNLLLGTLEKLIMAKDETIKMKDAIISQQTSRAHEKLKQSNAKVKEAEALYTKKNELFLKGKDEIKQSNVKIREAEALYSKKNELLLKGKDQILRNKETIIAQQKELIRRLEEQIEKLNIA